MVEKDRKLPSNILKPLSFNPNFPVMKRITIDSWDLNMNLIKAWISSLYVMLNNCKMELVPSSEKVSLLASVGVVW